MKSGSEEGAQLHATRTNGWKQLAWMITHLTEPDMLYLHSITDAVLTHRSSASHLLPYLLLAAPEHLPSFV